MIEDIHRITARLESCGAVAKPSAIAIVLTWELGELVTANAVRCQLCRWRKVQRDSCTLPRYAVPKTSRSR